MTNCDPWKMPFEAQKLWAEFWFHQEPNHVRHVESWSQGLWDMLGQLCNLVDISLPGGRKGSRE